jgi:hypothetical protein
LIQFILVITVITVIMALMAINARMANTLFPDALDINLWHRRLAHHYLAGVINVQRR